MRSIQSILTGDDDVLQRIDGDGFSKGITGDLTNVPTGNELRFVNRGISDETSIHSLLYHQRCGGKVPQKTYRRTPCVRGKGEKAR